MSRIRKEQSPMAKDLTVISRKTKEKEQRKTIRVAAYCRVSTDLECQRSSLENQMELFRHRIKNHPGWELCGIYVDKGLTGTSSKVRPDFLKMIADAEAGRIDYIITKSISRFARNTVDLLNYVRRLRDVGVGVFFEEQKLDTGTLFSEMLLTIHGAFAQEESHSISENLKSGKRKRYAMGIPQWFAVYGYRKGERKGEWEIIEEEADVIRLIFDMYVKGRSLPQICSFLNGNGVICRRRGVWEPTTLSGILHNEKYVGDVIMQKLYVPSLLSRNAVKNDGSVLPRYYLQDHHPAIIGRQTFLDVQVTALLKDYHRGSHQYPYLSFLRCPYCGERMIAVSLPRNKHGIAWTCGGPASEKVLRSERTSCPPFFVKTKYIDRAVLRAFSESGSQYVPVPETVEYGFLREHVSMITFARCDERVLFDELVIIWTDGRQSVIDIEYEKPSEFPVAFTEFVEGQYYADGIPMGRFGGTSRNIYVGRLISMDFCGRVRIYDNPNQEICPGKPEFGTMDIPVVIAPDSTKKEEKENE